MAKIKHIFIPGIVDGELEVPDEVIASLVEAYLANHPETDPTVPSWAKQPSKPTYTASEVGAYTKPSGGIPKSDLDQAVQTSLGKADTALQSAPVTSVNTKTGAVTLTASDVGAYVKPSGGIPASDLASGVIPTVPQMATAADMSDWTSGKTVDAATLKTDFNLALLDFDDLHVNKADKTEIPTKTSDLTNDSGYQTAQQVTAAISTAVSGKADKTPRIAKASTDTSATLNPNTLYVFTEMASLTITLAAPADNTIANEYHFIFTSGATATTLTLPSTVNLPDGFTVDANMVYEVSILENNMTAMSWEVST